MEVDNVRVRCRISINIYGSSSLHAIWQALRYRRPNMYHLDPGRTDFGPCSFPPSLSAVSTADRNASTDPVDPNVVCVTIGLLPGTHKIGKSFMPLSVKGISLSK